MNEKEMSLREIAKGLKQLPQQLWGD